MFEFRWQWESAPSVRSPVLAATWASWGMWCGDQPVIEALDLTAKSIRPNLYGSLMPVAHWALANWWFLLNEPLPHRLWSKDERVRFEGGAWLSRKGLADWSHRHSLKSAGHGFRYPEVIFARDGDSVLMRWAPDRDRSPEGKPVHFLGGGEARIPCERFEAALDALVRAVLLRLSGLDDPLAREFLAAYEKIQSSRQEEAELYRLTGMLGLDPDDEQELSDRWFTERWPRYQSLSPRLKVDFLQSSAPETFGEDLAWLEAHGALATALPVPQNVALDATSHAAHTGYALARELRRTLGLGDRPLGALWPLAQEVLGCGVSRVESSPPARSLWEGLLTLSPHADLIYVAPQGRTESERFRLSRALFFWLHGSGRTEPRLISSSKEWSQRASRAFAAEWLAPAAALSELVVDDERGLARAAEHFQVSELLIAHQVENQVDEGPR